MQEKKGIAVVENTIAENSNNKLNLKLSIQVII